MYLIEQNLEIELIKYNMGKEILEQLGEKKIGGFISGVGTGGTLMGIGKRLKETIITTKSLILAQDER